MNSEEELESRASQSGQPATQGVGPARNDTVSPAQDIITPEAFQPGSSEPTIITPESAVSSQAKPVADNVAAGGAVPASEPSAQYTQPSSSILTAEKPLLTQKKPRKKVIALTATLVTALLAGSVGWFIFNRNGNQGVEPGLASISASISSPVGLIPEIAESKSGRFKLDVPRAYANMPSIEGAYYIDDTGSVWFDAIPHIQKVNSLLDYLITRDGDDMEGVYKAAYDQGDLNASRFVSIDFADLFSDKQLLSRYPSIFTGFAHVAEQALNGKGFEEDAYGFKLTNECQSSVDSLRTFFSRKRLNTRDIAFIGGKSGDSYTYEIPQEIYDEKNQVVRAFFAECYEKSPSFDSNTHGGLLQQYPQISIAYSRSDDGYEMEIKTYNQNSSFAIQLTMTPDEEASERPDGDKRSLFEPQMRFGLAYEACRVVPVVVSGFDHSFYFAAEDTRYSPPSNLDDNYYCTVADANKDSYYNARRIQFKIGQVGEAFIPAGGPQYKYLVLHHDVGYFVERHHVEKGAYPTQQELLAMKDMPEGMTIDLKELIDNGLFEYEVLPAGCDTRCDSYSFKYHMHSNLIINKEPFSKMLTEKVKVLE